MTPLDILVAAIQGQPAPRIPVFCNLLDQGARELGMSQAEYYSRGEHVAEGQLRLNRRYGHDNVWSLFYVGKEAEFFGDGRVVFADDGAPNLGEFAIQTWDDIAKLEVPADLTAHPAWAETAKCLQILRAEVGATHPICAYLTASTSLPTLLMGIESWLELLLTGPADLRDHLLAKCSEFFQKEQAAYRAAGANVLIYSTPFGSVDMVGRQRFQSLALPWMKRDLTVGGRMDVHDMVYYCGMSPFNDVLDSVIDELGITMHYVSPLADLAEAKRVIDDRCSPRGAYLTCGVIDDIRLVHSSPQQARTEVERLIGIGTRGGRQGSHFLFGTGVMPMAIPDQTICAMLDAAFAAGRLA